ncbi:unnamed protein product [Durusdinium trenchii]|uniref:Uncharacterized protein n=1 Tax=Durusdinium trenchii TaxID=1381693 RepID=A0ABP0SAL5_9DINO
MGTIFIDDAFAIMSCRTDSSLWATFIHEGRTKQQAFTRGIAQLQLLRRACYEIQDWKARLLFNYVNFGAAPPSARQATSGALKGVDVPSATGLLDLSTTLTGCSRRFDGAKVQRREIRQVEVNDEVLSAALQCPGELWDKFSRDVYREELRGEYVFVQTELQDHREDYHADGSESDDEAEEPLEEPANWGFLEKLLARGLDFANLAEAWLRGDEAPNALRRVVLAYSTGRRLGCFVNGQTWTLVSFDLDELDVYWNTGVLGRPYHPSVGGFRAFEPLQGEADETSGSVKRGGLVVEEVRRAPRLRAGRERKSHGEGDAKKSTSQTESTQNRAESLGIPEVVAPTSLRAVAALLVRGTEKSLKAPGEEVRGPILVLYKVELHQCCRLRRVDGLKPEVYVGGVGATYVALPGALLGDSVNKAGFGQHQFRVDHHRRKLVEPSGCSGRLLRLRASSKKQAAPDEPRRETAVVLWRSWKSVLEEVASRPGAGYLTVSGLVLSPVELWFALWPAFTRAACRAKSACRARWSAYNAGHGVELNDDENVAKRKDHYSRAEGHCIVVSDDPVQSKEGPGGRDYYAEIKMEWFKPPSPPSLSSAMEPSVVGVPTSAAPPAPPARATPEIEERLVQLMASMEPLRPEILRCTCAFRALKGLQAKSLRSRVNPKVAYSWSHETKDIQQFWSHSWRRSGWSKIFMLAVMHNGFPALCCGTLTAISVSILFHVFSEPVNEEIGDSLREQYTAALSVGRVAGLISNFSAMLVGALCLAYWRCQKTVFLDMVCIHQKDSALKMAGLVSMGAFLKESNSMLVCWDATYNHRLWCLFELAAFLKSRGNSTARPLVVRPTALGPVALGLFTGLSLGIMSLLLVPRAGSSASTITLRILVLLGVFLLVLRFPIRYLRSFYRSIDTMREQLQSFRVTDATCHCCTVDHRGGAMHCDREVIQQCLVQWFGSIENFEKSVQTNVSEALLHQLGYFSFPISWMLACAAPVTWSFLPYAIQEPLFGTLFIFAWTFAVPTIFMIASSSSYLLRRPRASRLGDAVVNVACVFMCAGSYLAMESYVGLLSATLNYWQGILTFASTMLLAMAAAYGSWAGCGAYGRCLWARSSGRFGDVEDSSATDEWVGEAPNPNAAVTIQL